MWGSGSGGLVELSGSGPSAAPRPPWNREKTEENSPGLKGSGAERELASGPWDQVPGCGLCFDRYELFQAPGAARPQTKALTNV